MKIEITFEDTLVDGQQAVKGSLKTDPPLCLDNAEIDYPAKIYALMFIQFMQGLANDIVKEGEQVKH